jgi:Glutaredoxin-like domain (DUF836)
MIELKLLSRPGCHLCEEMRVEVDRLLGAEPHAWDVVDVDSDDELARRWSDSIPVLFVNGRLFAKVRIPKLATRLRLLKAAAGAEGRTA